MSAAQDPAGEPTESQHKSRSGLARIGRAFGYSIDGFRAAWQGEAAFRQEIAVVSVLLPAAILMPATLTQKAMLIGSLLIVLVTELLNSAVESAVDRISLENHALAKRAKDIGSAAVFVAFGNLAVIWILIMVEVFIIGT